jgi:hypothetical protein
VPLLRRCLAIYERREKRGVQAAMPAEAAAAFAAVRRDVAACRDCLADALAKATAPAGEVDWAKVRRARDAYARGETRPVREARKHARAVYPGKTASVHFHTIKMD